LALFFLFLFFYNRLFNVTDMGGLQITIQTHHQQKGFVNF